MSSGTNEFQVLPFPYERQVTVEGGAIAAQRHTIYGLIEADVTRARHYLRAYKQDTGESLSFTAFLIACLGQAIEPDKMMHAYRDWRNRLILFDAVDVNTSVEIEMDGHKMVLPHLVRAVNRRTVRDLHDEIRAVQAKPHATNEFKARWFARLPGLVRKIFYRAVYRLPHALKASFGTVGLTAVGMFGTGGGWAIPFGVHTLDVGVGGIADKPGVVDGRIEIREYLCLTLCFDHDMIDGGRAARFTHRFRQLIENGYGLCEAEASQAQPGSDLAWRSK